jgi:hypothetical protein
MVDRSPQVSSHDDIDDVLVDLLKNADQPVGAAFLMEELARVGRGVSSATLARRLEKLIAGRRVTRTGQARATRYSPDTYHDYFALPPTQRPRVGYNASALESYIPNETAWLSSEDRLRLEEAGGGRRLDASTYSGVITPKLLVDLSYASSALEGNTYTYLDTQVLIEYGKEAEGKDRDETVMILNHKEAITYLTQNIVDIEITPREIKTFHALLSRGLSNMDPRDVGSIRRMPIDHIGGSAYLPMAIPQRLEAELETIAAKARAIVNPFERSLFLLAFISYLQAFRDVNKRTARLVCNIPLLDAGLAPLSFLEMDKTGYVKGLLSFYELNRIDLLTEVYIEAYVKSAARYDAYVGRPKAIVDLEMRRGEDIYSAVRKFVSARATGETSESVVDFAIAHFSDESAEMRQALAERVAAVVDSLSDANSIAYGISRDEYAAFEAADQQIAHRA